jgi:uncharacterized membrane protein
VGRGNSDEGKTFLLHFCARILVVVAMNPHAAIMFRLAFILLALAMAALGVASYLEYRSWIPVAISVAGVATCLVGVFAPDLS